LRPAVVATACNHIELKAPSLTVLDGDFFLGLGQKLFEGKGKSGSSFIKDVSLEGVRQIYSWSAQVQGAGRAAGVDCFITVTAKGMTPPKGLGAAKDQGIFRTSTGEMGTVKGFDIAKMVAGKNTSVGLWTFRTMSDSLAWLNDTIAIVTFEGLDPMWQEFKMEIWEWT
jgi:hypothetical protein